MLSEKDQVCKKMVDWVEQDFGGNIWMLILFNYLTIFKIMTDGDVMKK